MLFVELTGQWKIGRIQQSVVDKWKQILQRGKLSWSLGSGSVLLLQPFCQQSLKPLVAWRRDVMESSTNMKTLRPTLHPCGTFLFKVSDHNVLCLNHSKGKVKLDFFLIKAIFWIKPFFQFLLCHFIPFFYPLWRKDLKLPTLTVCCGIWVVAFVTSSGGRLVFVPFCPITTSATNQAFLNWTRSRCILGKSASACSMNREHMYLCIIDVLVQSRAALLAQSWMGGGAL